MADFLRDPAASAAPSSRGQPTGQKQLEENCGVFGVVGPANSSRQVFFGLYALNHRGQESAGIASLDRSGIHVHKGMGLVSQVFDEHDIEQLPGAIAIGHTRYSTAGGSKLAGAQPFVLETDLGQLAIAHNGQVAKQAVLRKLVLGRGVGLFSNSDSEVIAQMLARPHDPAEAAAFAAAGGVKTAPAPSASSSSSSSAAAADGGASAAAAAASSSSAAAAPSPAAAAAAAAAPATPTPSTPAALPVWACWLARIAAFMRDCEGAYSLVALTKDALYGVRDPYGLRPLCVGRAQAPDGSWSYYLASESCALGTVGGDFVRELRPGEAVRLDRNGISSWMPLAEPVLPSLAAVSVMPKTPSFCVFEYVYFARPDSIMEGQLVHSARTRLGARLAREAPVLDADIVSGVPDSSIAAAIGYANELKLPFSEVFCKNRYIGRTFIKPDDSLRKNAIQLKYNPLTHVLKDKKVVLVDDSLVRGNTLRQLVPLLRKGGAKEVHVRISSPPIRHPCYYGVDIGT
jgi:amidophosphoribosyltransferase